MNYKTESNNTISLRTDILNPKLHFHSKSVSFRCTKMITDIRKEKKGEFLLLAAFSEVNQAVYQDPAKLQKQTNEKKNYINYIK